MSAPSAAQLIALRQATQQASKGFASYNFRQYFVRRTNLRFDAAPAESSPELPSWYEARLSELEVLKRASVVNKIFEGPKLIVERDGMEQEEKQTAEKHIKPDASNYTC